MIAFFRTFLAQILLKSGFKKKTNLSLAAWRSGHRVRINNGRTGFGSHNDVSLSRKAAVV
jgi:hypothetical protein